MGRSKRNGKTLDCHSYTAFPTISRAIGESKVNRLDGSHFNPFSENCLLQIINALKCITGVTVKSKAIGFQVHCVMLGKPGGEVTGLDGFFRSPLRNLVQPWNLWMAPSFVKRVLEP